MANNIKKSSIGSENEIGKLIKLVVIVTLIAVCFYFLTILINKEDKEEETKVPASIQFDYILTGNILNRPNDEYYVLAIFPDDVNIKIYDVYINSYQSKDGALRMYYTELDNPLNDNFVASESNFKINDISDLKFNQTTLIKVKKGKIEKYYEGKEEITSLLEEISKAD